MEVHNAVIPNTEQLEGFLQPGAEGPIFMVNLLKFKTGLIMKTAAKPN